MILLFIPDDNESSRMKQIQTCFGTQAKKIDIIIYFMARKFDEEKCLAFPKAHILTGCDGTSRVTAFEAKPNL